jgi:FkbM family methyltransferase
LRWVRPSTVLRVRGMSIVDLMRFGRRMIRSAAGRDVGYFRQIRASRLRLGAHGASWCVCPEGLGSDSVVYSFGVGEDVSFELALIDQFRLRVDAFDPTPRSLMWIKAQSLPSLFRLHEIGLAAWDGTAPFNPPKDPRHVSYSMVRAAGHEPGVYAPVCRLSTIAAMLGHASIDVLKMDIEGAEYDVLADCLSSGIHIGQILIEFHHRWPSIGVARTKRAIALLRAAGYRIADVSPSGCEYTLLRRQEAGRADHSSRWTGRSD